MNNFLKDLAEDNNASVEEKPLVNTKNREEDGRMHDDNGVRQRVTRCTKQQPVAKAKDFNVVKYSAVYEQKQKHRIALEDKRLKEQRSFTSKPAPNFHAIHAADNQKRAQEPVRYTVPSTPKVMHRHRDGVERVRKKVYMTRLLILFDQICIYLYEIVYRNY